LSATAVNNILSYPQASGITRAAGYNKQKLFGHEMTQSIYDWKKRNLQKFKERKQKFLKLYTSINTSLTIALLLSLLALLFYKRFLIIPLAILSAIGIINLAMAFHLRIVAVPRFGYASFENEYNTFSFGVLSSFVCVFLPVIYLLFNR